MLLIVTSRVYLALSPGQANLCLKYNARLTTTRALIVSGRGWNYIWVWLLYVHLQCLIVHFERIPTRANHTQIQSIPGLFFSLPLEKNWSGNEARMNSNEFLVTYTCTLHTCISTINTGIDNHGVQTVISIIIVGKFRWVLFSLRSARKQKNQPMKTKQYPRTVSYCDDVPRPQNENKTTKKLLCLQRQKRKCLSNTVQIRLKIEKCQQLLVLASSSMELTSRQNSFSTAE